MDAQEAKKKKRQMIIEAARVVFAQRGYTGTLVAQIASQAGVGKGTVYEYFGSKEEVFLAVFQDYMDRLTQGIMVEINALGGSVQQRLEAIVDRVIAAFEAERESYGLVMEFWSAAAVGPMRNRFLDLFRQAYHHLRALITGLFQQGVSNGEFKHNLDFDALGAALIGAVDAICLQAWFDPQVDAADTSRKFVQAMMLGLLASEQGD